MPIANRMYLLCKSHRDFIEWMLLPGSTRFVVSSFYWDLCKRVLNDDSYYDTDQVALNELHKDYAETYIRSKR